MKTINVVLLSLMFTSCATQYHNGVSSWSEDADSVELLETKEYNRYTMNSKQNDDIKIDSYAVEVGYFLTGESIVWSKGYTSGLKPKSKYGAWQLAARIESTEIVGDVDGTDEVDKFTIGLNYYPTSNINLMLNYDKVTDLTVNGSSVSFEPSGLKFRANAYW